jgi:hypothetical protein
MAPKFRDVVRHVLLFERDQRGVHHRIYGQMPFTAAQPRGCIVDAAQGSDSQRQSVNAELQLLAVPAFEDFQVHRHTVEGCNWRTTRYSELHASVEALNQHRGHQRHEVRTNLGLSYALQKRR